MRLQNRGRSLIRVLPKALKSFTQVKPEIVGESLFPERNFDIVS